MAWSSRARVVFVRVHILSALLLAMAAATPSPLTGAYMSRRQLVSLIRRPTTPYHTDSSIKLTMSCPNELPADGYPEGYSQSSFSSLEDLCWESNAGCRCFDEGGPPDCETPPGNEDLYRQFADICERDCRCPSGEPSTPTRNDTTSPMCMDETCMNEDQPSSSMSTGTFPFQSPTPSPQGGAGTNQQQGAATNADQDPPAQAAAGRTPPGRTPPGRTHLRQTPYSRAKSKAAAGAQGTQGQATNPDPNASQTWGSQMQTGGSAQNGVQCPSGNCNSAADCGALCVCMQSISSQIDALGNAIWTSGCGSKRSTYPGKRDNFQHPCICNSSYVSYACCSETSGIVHEPPNLRLGQVDRTF